MAEHGNLAKRTGSKMGQHVWNVTIVTLLLLVLVASGLQTWAERDAASACEAALLELRSR